MTDITQATNERRQDRMPGESDKVPAGWYPAPHGGQRYWDGQRWLALPDPDDSTVAPAAVATGSAEKAAGGRKKVIAPVIALIVLAAAGIGVFWKNSHDTQMQNAAIAASSSKAAADKAAADAAEADRVRRDTEATRAQRAAGVKYLEASIKTLAQKHIADGLFDGPVLSVSCDPVGGSTDDLTAKTTVFECFVATKDNGDGTFSGEKYHATMNWDTGDYTYGFGPAR